MDDQQNIRSEIYRCNRRVNAVRVSLCSEEIRKQMMSPLLYVGGDTVKHLSVMKILVFFFFFVSSNFMHVASWLESVRVGQHEDFG